MGLRGKKAEVDNGEVDAVEAAKKDKAFEEEVKAEVPEAGAPAPDGPRVLAMTMPDKLPRYRVAVDWSGSMNGSITHMMKGKLIDPRGYGGMPGINGLKKAGLVLEKVTE